MPSLGRAARYRDCNLTDTRACVSPLLGDIFSHVFICNSDGFHPLEMSEVLDSVFVMKMLDFFLPFTPKLISTFRILSVLGDIYSIYFYHDETHQK